MKRRKSTYRRKPATIPDLDSTEADVPNTSPGDVTQEVKADAVMPDAPEAAVKEAPKKSDTRPVSVVSVRYVKNIYGSPVNVGADKTPSGKEYRFATNQSLPVDPEDYHFLLSLGRNPGAGCCGGTSAAQAQRHYFEGIQD